MRPPVRVLDTGALLGYAYQADSHVAYQLAFCADQQLRMQASVLCVAEAYRDCDGDAVDMLDILLSLGAVEVTECRAQDGDVVGNIAKRVKRLSLAHSCMLVWQSDAPLITTDSVDARKVLESGLVWDLGSPGPR